MLPLRTLFEVDHKSPHYNESKKQSIFYAQSWALMHYLIIGKAGKVEQLGKVHGLLDAKVPMEQAFQQAFETPFEVMEKDLREYIKKDRYNVINGHFEKKLELDTTTEATHVNRSRSAGISRRSVAPQQPQERVHVSRKCVEARSKSNDGPCFARHGLLS